MDVLCLDFKESETVRSCSEAVMVMERGFAAVLTCAREPTSAGLQTVPLLLAGLEPARPVQIDQEVDYGGKIQLVITVTK